jgi:hypothetical protein
VLFFGRPGCRKTRLKFARPQHLQWQCIANASAICVPGQNTTRGVEFLQKDLAVNHDVVNARNYVHQEIQSAVRCKMRINARA